MSIVFKLMKGRPNALKKCYKMSLSRYQHWNYGRKFACQKDMEKYHSDKTDMWCADYVTQLALQFGTEISMSNGFVTKWEKDQLK